MQVLAVLQACTARRSSGLQSLETGLEESCLHASQDARAVQADPDAACSCMRRDFVQEPGAIWGTWLARDLST